MSQRRTLKNYRNTWLEKSKRNLHKAITFGPVEERNAFLRNLKGINVMRTIKSTKKDPYGFHIPYPKRPKGNYKYNKGLEEAAVRYRTITNQWTPSYGTTYLNAKLSKILANVHEAAAPNYNYEKMSFKVGSRNDLSDEDKELLLQRLYELYGHNTNNNNTNNNSNTWSINGEVGAPSNEPANAVTWIEPPTTMPSKQSKGRPLLPPNWR
jgi:hypothetical protein